LEVAYSEQQTTEYKNELSDKHLMIEELESDIKAVQNVNKNQSKALNGLNREAPNDEYVSKYKDLVIENKDEMRKLADECKTQDRKLKEQHGQVSI
jgi:hypothetical protein